jgi:hypothetical protein
MALSPKTITYPSPADYLAGMVNGVAGAYETHSLPAQHQLSPVIMQYTDSLVVALEGATGLSADTMFALANNAYVLASATEPVAVIAAVRGLLMNVTSVVAQVSTAVGVSASVVQIIPIVGQIVELVLGMVSSALESIETFEKEKESCYRALHQVANDVCARTAQIAAASTAATRSSGPTASDIFRPIYYAQQGLAPLGTSWGQATKEQLGKLPICPASVFVALCGDAVPEPLERGPNLLHPNVRKRMWRLIEGILAGVEPTHLAPTPMRAGDGGSSLYPILADIVWSEWAVHGRIDDDDIGTVVREITSRYMVKRTCEFSYPSAVTKKHIYTTCEPRTAASLYASFYGAITAHQNWLFDNFWDPVANDWALARPSQSPAANAFTAAMLATPTRITRGRVGRAVPGGAKAVVGASSATILAAATALAARLL